MMKKILIIIFAALVLFAGCYIQPPEEDEEEQFAPSATRLTENIWADGNIGALDEEQWFKFTATAVTQYIHVSHGTLNALYVQLYNNDGSALGNKTELFGTKYASSSSLTVGQEYYINVTPSGYSNSGSYRIAFNTSDTAPTTLTLPSNAIQLAINKFTDGNIPESSGEQWFKFTATAVTQYIHVNLGTLTDLYIQLYDSNDGYGDPFQSEERIYTHNDKYIPRTLIIDQEYYIKVKPNSSFNSKGTYQITFSTLFIKPGTVTKELTADTWADGNITTDGEEQWFNFTATNDSQYIHASFGTMSDLSGLYVQLYDIDGNKVGGETNLCVSVFDPNAKCTNRTLNAAQKYYIKVWSRNTGTYKIAFNTSTTPPTP